MQARIDANGDAEFYASGRDAVIAQAGVTTQHIRSRTLVQIVAYCMASVFVIVASLLIVFAPEGRETATWIVGASLLLISAGVTGFTKLRVETPGMKLEADRGSNTVRADGPARDAARSEGPVQDVSRAEGPFRDEAPRGEMRA